MKNLFTLKHLFVAFAALGLLFLGALDSAVNAQVGKDPFGKPAYERQPKPRAVKRGSKKGTTPAKPKGPQVVSAPSIEARINYYKQMREEAALNGRPIPKVTSVLLLSEMSVMGIIKTPRGFQAMVEATPIKLSYTIRPGEKFFDGQLVAVEENRLVFRRVTKFDNGKFVASVENKALRKYSMQQDIQGTTPESGKFDEKAEQAKAKPAEKGVIISPVDEMNSQPADKEKVETAKKTKKSSKKKRK